MDPGTADNVAVQGKGSLPDALKKCLRRMRPKAPFSHNATNYDKWMAAAEPYDITYSPQVQVPGMITASMAGGCSTWGNGLEAVPGSDRAEPGGA